MIEQNNIDWIVKNFNQIDKKWKTSLIVMEPHSYWSKEDKLISTPPTNKPKPKGLSEDDNEAIFLLNRQKPSVEASYDFDEERIGITSKGKIIWGFDSGCSCPCPWDDSYPDCYNITEKTWKEFIVKDLTSFDGGAMDEMEKTLSEIKEEVEL